MPRPRCRPQQGAGSDAALAQDFGVRYAVGGDSRGDGLVGPPGPARLGQAVDGRTVSTLDLFGDWLTVLTGPAASGGGRRRPTWRSRPHAVTLRWADELTDPDREFAAAYGLGGR